VGEEIPVAMQVAKGELTIEYSLRYLEMKSRGVRAEIHNELFASQGSCTSLKPLENVSKVRTHQFTRSDGQDQSFS
jgi:hypothetical protein